MALSPTYAASVSSNRQSEALQELHAGVAKHGHFLFVSKCSCLQNTPGAHSKEHSKCMWCLRVYLSQFIPVTWEHGVIRHLLLTEARSQCGGGGGGSTGVGRSVS